MVAKLTLSVDRAVVEAAKRYAAETGTSVSQLVQGYLTAIAAPRHPAQQTPILSKWRGSIRGGDVDDHRDHLVEKYGG